MRIHELAKELNLQSKDVIERARGVGYDVTSASSSLTADEAATLKDRILRKDTNPSAPAAAFAKDRPTSETAIVRVKPKAKDEEKKEVVHKTKKANVKLPTPVKPKARTTDVPAPAEKEAPSAVPRLREDRVNRGDRPPAPAPGIAPGLAPSAAPAPGVKPIIIQKKEQGAEANDPKNSEARPSLKSGMSAKASVGAKTTGTSPARENKPDAATGSKPSTTIEPEKTPQASSCDSGQENQGGDQGVLKTAQPNESGVVKESVPSVDESKIGGSAEASEKTEVVAKTKETAETKTGEKNEKAKQDGEHKKERFSKSGKSNKGGRTDSDAKPEHKKTGTDDKKESGSSASKNKDKKGSKAKGPKGESSGDSSRKNAPKYAKRRGTSDNYRGTRRGPILEDSSLEKRPLKSGRRPKAQSKAEQEAVFIPEDLAPGTKIITVPITVAGFADQVGKTSSETIMAIMSLGLMMNVNSNLDETTAMLLGDQLGVPIYIAHDEGDITEAGIENFEDDPTELESRPPIITVMGHVDHGKTSLLDAIRETNVTIGEAGGITQHIGASEVMTNGHRIVFLDTPGHEAFTAMRARGAHVTDIAVLVVAADDGVMPQTIESLSHAKSAGVPIIVAINKIDKDGANIDRVKQELSEHNILVEEWGGDTQSVTVSAKTGEGINELLDAILLQAEILELKANPNRLALGTVVEARLDKSRGSVATLLVLNGTLEIGQSIVAGQASGRIRAMTDYKGKNIKKAGPATAIEITGLSEVPQAGDEFNAVREDRTARDIAEGRKLRQRDEIMQRTSGVSLDTLFETIGAGEVKDLNLIIKGDVQGSIGALTSSLEKLSNDEVKINIIHRGVGTVNESDVMLAETSSAIIIGFNVRPGSSVTALADKSGVEIRTYRVIYDAINDVEAAMKGMLDPEFRENVIGKVEVRDTFKVPGVGTIGGSYVLEGKVQRSAEVRVVRDGIVVHEGKISSLKRFKDDVREVATGYECGIGIENYNDIKEGDIIEAFIMEEIARD